TLPYLLEIADKGAEKALKENSALMHGLNTYNGCVTCKGVADTFNLEYVSADKCLSAFS
ncbi:MAG: alanine dehydrogenase, partial [Firmicutes bacterium]|nr:alanine dehydrogenase [Bacillota bacterium]